MKDMTRDQMSPQLEARVESKSYHNGVRQTAPVAGGAPHKYGALAATAGPEVPNQTASHSSSHFLSLDTPLPLQGCEASSSKATAGTLHLLRMQKREGYLTFHIESDLIVKERPQILKIFMCSKQIFKYFYS